MTKNTTRPSSWFSFCQFVLRGSVLLLMIHGRKKDRSGLWLETLGLASHSSSYPSSPLFTEL